MSPHIFLLFKIWTLNKLVKKSNKLAQAVTLSAHIPQMPSSDLCSATGYADYALPF
jgi:hypothetical protein